MEKVVMWKTMKEAAKEEKLEAKKGKRREEETRECKVKIQCASTELQTSTIMRNYCTVTGICCTSLGLKNQFL